MPTWDAASKYKLLLSIITVLDAKPPKWEEVVKLMGPGYTAESVRQQYQKIKRQTTAELAALDDGSTVTVSPSPRKRGKANGGTPKSNGKRKGAAAEENEDEEELEESPSKKSKVKRESNGAKVEHDDDLYD